MHSLLKVTPGSPLGSGPDTRGSPGLGVLTGSVPRSWPLWSLMVHPRGQQHHEPVARAGRRSWVPPSVPLLRVAPAWSRVPCLVI